MKGLLFTEHPFLKLLTLSFPFSLPTGSPHDDLHQIQIVEDCPDLDYGLQDLYNLQKDVFLSFS